MRTSLEEYISKYGEEEGKKKFEINRKKAITLENMIAKYGKEEGYIRYNNFKLKLKNTKGFDNYKKTHPNVTIEEYKQLFNHTSLNSFIKKYGEEEGIKRFNLYRNKNSDSNKQTRLAYIEKYGKEEYKKTHCVSLENLIKKYGEEEGNKRWLKYLERQSFANSIEGYISRYGEDEGKQKWYEYIEKQRKSNKNGSEHFKYINSINYYINTYGEELGKIKYEEYKQKQDRSSLKYFLKKYGDKEIAYQKYKENCKKSAQKHHSYYSLQSQELFKSLYDFILLFDNNPDIQYAELNKEYSLYDENGKIKFYDFRYKNIIIEFNGDYWHGNPIIYKENDIVRGSITAKQLWEQDQYKKELAEKHNFNILYIWENEYENDKITTIKNILEYIKNHL